MVFAPGQRIGPTMPFRLNSEFHAPRRRILVSVASAFVVAFLCGWCTALASYSTTSLEKAYQFLPGFSPLVSVLAYIGAALIGCGYAFSLVAFNVPKSHNG